MVAALLLTAGFLEPSPEGMGTHRQLGLPPCSFVRMFGKPCPACGMTTSWSHFMRGSFVRSATANPGGLMLAVIAMLASPWLIVSGIRGRWFIGPPSLRLATALAIIVPAVTLIQWIVRLNGS